GTSPWKIWEHRWDHVDHLLEIVGLKRPWEQDPTVLGNATIGWVIAGLFFAVALPGLVWALTRRADVHLAVYALVAFVIGASFRVPVNRYLATVAPLLLLLALALVARLARSGPRPWIAGLLTTVAVGAIAAGNLANAHLRIDRADEFAAAGSVEWGPTHPDAVEMFDQVRERTDPDDVIGAPKARAMTFATERLAVQVDDFRPIPEIGVALVVTEPGTEIHRTLLGDATFEPVWSNTRFSIFEPTDER
ncbi:MAG: hypothetical protein ACLGHQ_09840, partial [Acidimicrobiia bacterium]